MTLRIGWFTPIASQTGIATYSAQVLEEMCALSGDNAVEMVVFHPPFEGPRVDMPCPTIELSEALLDSDFWALFDVAVYHLGNNSRHHAPIYAALMRHPGIVVMHDHVYQHYLAGVSLQGDHIGPSYVALAQNADAGSFRVLKSSGVLQADMGEVHFVPWESEWATRVPLGDRFVDLGLGAVVHSDYAKNGLQGNGAPADADSDILTLFMTAPDARDVALPKPAKGRPVRIACCGHIGGTKGLRELVNAFIKSPHLHESFHVTIAGFGSDTAFLAELRRTIAEARLGEIFDIRVDPSDGEYHEVMVGCDLFYNLRYPNTEGASLSLMEQLAYGRPVIAYRTGSFAEMPDKACYFLDEVGDTDALITVLERIAATPSEIAKKGAAARAAVADKTPENYAQRFVAHVRGQMDTFRRRSGLAQMRARGTPEVPQEDLDWFLRFLQARSEMQDFYGNRLWVPDSLDDMPTATKGDYVAANYLGTRVDARSAALIGALCENVDPLDLYDFVGKLLLIVSVSEEHGLIDRELRSVALPITDPVIWRVLSCLPTVRGAYLAMHALGLEVQHDQLEGLTTRIHQLGFRAAMHQQIIEQPGLWETHIADTPLAAFFEDQTADQAKALIAPQMDMNLLDHVRTPEPEGAMALLSGFHAPETIGIWASATPATLYLNLDEMRPARAISGALALLPGAVAASGTVQIRVEEIQTNRRVSGKAQITAATQGSHPWALALPEFAGPITIEFRVDQLHSPSEDGISGDNRAMGPLVQSLELSETPLPETAPDIAPARTAKPKSKPRKSKRASKA